MEASAAGMKLQLPEGFGLQEARYVFAGPPERPPHDEAAVPVRPSLVIHHQPAVPGESLDDAAARFTAELMNAIPQMTDVDRAELVFADGAVGRLTAFTFTAAPGARLRQLHAFRLEGPRVVSLTLTVNADALGERGDAPLLEMLARTAREVRS
ncbi:MAG TPA: DcrB-related protein [Gemmatimonadales bacterium]|nr:DcrB-related protein [Gemmatimonadales bacterium]